MEIILQNQIKPSTRFFKEQTVDRLNYVDKIFITGKRDQILSFLIRLIN